MSRLARKIAELDALDAEFGPRLTRADAHLSGDEVWTATDQMQAYIEYDLAQDDVLRSIRADFRPYLDSLGRRYQRETRLGKLLGWALVALTFVPAIAFWIACYWLLGHQGTRLIWRDVEAALGSWSGVLGWILGLTAIWTPLWLGSKVADRAYRWGYHIATGRAPDDASV